ncbi:propanediol utilization protein [Bacillus sp. OxB-1]|uniref:phosphate propanoyltransferase n=1 Tax=Bacillus sp. (strain OxB-1) TaxID=98228 RepID=UPI000581EED7|nr:phosphate propanoyltransferase [Bacillus sp. OxB-1]BAQ08889.1 propanediol utilization protein [Bacillus sp. OxB-1]
MDRQWIEKVVADVTVHLRETVAAASPDIVIPVAVSARHVHLSLEDVGALFGEGYELTKRRELSQPGQFVSNETVVIAGPKGSLEHVRVLGPARKLTQAEISRTDAMKIGLRPPIRESGNIKGSASCTLIGPAGSVSLPEGLIIAQAHIHMSPRDAKNFGVIDGEFVTVEVSGERPLTIDKVLIRVSDRYRLEMHIDTDEANAGFIRSGAPGRIAAERTGIGKHN